jgi:hypothetical protein
MEITPGDGLWLVSFSGSGSGSAQGSVADFAIHRGSVLHIHSQRTIDGNDNVPMHTQALVTGGAAVVISVRARISSGTFTIRNRDLIVLRVTQL